MNDWAELIHRRVHLHYEKYGKEPECIPMTELEFKALEQEVEQNFTLKKIRDEERKKWEQAGIDQIHFFEGIQIKII